MQSEVDPPLALLYEVFFLLVRLEVAFLWALHCEVYIPAIVMHTVHDAHASLNRGGKNIVGIEQNAALVKRLLVRCASRYSSLLALCIRQKRVCQSYLNIGFRLRVCYGLLNIGKCTVVKTIIIYHLYASMFGGTYSFS